MAQTDMSEVDAEMTQSNELVEQRQFMATALRNANYAFGSGFPDGSLYICNQAFCDLTGYTEEELRAMSWAVDLTPEEWREIEMEKLRELHRTGKPQSYEKEYIRKDGSRIPIEIETHMICDEAGEPKLYYAFVSDITARKQALEKLQRLYRISRDLNLAQDEADLLNVLSRPARASDAFNAAIMYIDLNQAGEPEWFEVAAVWQREGDHPIAIGTRVRLLDYPFSQLFIKFPDEPQFVTDILTDERIDARLRETLKPLNVRGMVFIPLAQGGRWSGVMPIAWDEPHEFGEEERELYRAIMQLAAPAMENHRLLDNLEKMAEQRTLELQETRRMLQLVLDTIPMGIYWKDQNLAYLGCNKIFARDAGIEYSEEIIGKNDFDLEWSTYADLYQSDDQQVIETGEPKLNYQELYTASDGSQFWLRMSKVPLLDADGRVTGILGVYDDVTKQKQMQAERERLQQEIIEAQQQTLRELSTPIIPVMDRILVMPLIGSIDTMRARDITRSLLAGIREHRAKVVILDITGVPIVDSGVADHLNKTIQAARLKGAHTIITGISDAVAETIVDLGIDWSGIETLSDLQTGLIVALNSLGVKLVQR